MVDNKATPKVRDFSIAGIGLCLVVYSLLMANLCGVDIPSVLWGWLLHLIVALKALAHSTSVSDLLLSISEASARSTYRPDYWLYPVNVGRFLWPCIFLMGCLTFVVGMFVLAIAADEVNDQKEPLS